ncbi:hypothetical protein BH708_03130 [Brachybacterium sp. P6-10-X1]|nr:hypothetical protein BH708_03130 [Brachybacterium sp. P6-10-X1]
MPTVAEAATAGDLLSIRDLLAEEVQDRLGYASPGVRSSCTMVCLMWQVVVSTAPRVEEAASIARCMLIDALALLGPS